MRLLAAFLVLFASSTARAENWTCSAPGMVTGSYDGGPTAYIHLSGFNRGSDYPVQKKGSRATGVTKNGTRFVCTRG